jgi:hypothetical protein
MLRQMIGGTAIQSRMVQTLARRRGRPRQHVRASGLVDADHEERLDGAHAGRERGRDHRRRSLLREGRDLDVEDAIVEAQPLGAGHAVDQQRRGDAGLTRRRCSPGDGQLHHLVRRAAETVGDRARRGEQELEARDPQIGQARQERKEISIE